MTVGCVGSPHIDMNDRGYIKGVATDLDGYLKLRSAKNIGHYFDAVIHLHVPRFRKSKFSQIYIDYCNDLIEKAKDELDEFVEEKKHEINVLLHNLTGLSLLNYVRNI